jgi:cleavage and polyadenylation specificity factor subunit 3
MMFLEAQFGADNVEPIAEPKLPPTPPRIEASSPEQASESSSAGEEQQLQKPGDDDDKEKERQKEAELARLHRLGVPVPGIRVRIDDKLDAKVWLESLEVECANKVFADRVRAVVERAVEVAAPLWG